MNLILLQHHFYLFKLLVCFLRISTMCFHFLHMFYLLFDRGSRTEHATICIPFIVFITRSSKANMILRKVFRDEWLSHIPRGSLKASCSSGGTISCQWGVAERKTPASPEREREVGRRHHCLDFKKRLIKLNPWRKSEGELLLRAALMRRYP